VPGRTPSRGPSTRRCGETLTQPGLRRWLAGRRALRCDREGGDRDDDCHTRCRRWNVPSRLPRTIGPFESAASIARSCTPPGLLAGQNFREALSTSAERLFPNKRSTAWGQRGRPQTRMNERRITCHAVQTRTPGPLRAIVDLWRHPPRTRCALISHRRGPHP